MEGYISKERFVGALGLIERKGKTVYCESYGYVDRETKRPIKTDTIFRIYSMTKPITSVAAMMLYEEGKFSLDDPLSKHLPDFEGVKVGVTAENGTDLSMEDCKTPPTVRHLMTHTAGLSYGGGPSPVDALYAKAKIMARNENLETMVTKLGKLPLLHQPGQTWHYSLSTDVLGRLVEVLSGQPLDKFFEERIFQPLGMADTSFYCPPDKVDRLAGNYFLGPDNKAVSIPTGGPRQDYTRKPAFFSGGGGLVSTTEDYLRLFQMVLKKGTLDKAQILKPETFDLIYENHIGEAKVGDSGMAMAISKDGFGLGFNRSRAPGEGGGSMTHGWGGAAGTSVWVDPEKEIIGLWMIQIYNQISGFRFRVLAYDAFKD